MSETVKNQSGDTARQKIMEAAGRLFAEKGYSETTTLAIAKESGVNETTIFRNFGNKKNLYMEIFCANTPGAESILLSGLTNGADLKKDLSLMFREYLNTCVQHIPNYRLSVQQIDELQDPTFYRESTVRFDNMTAQMVSYLNMLRSFGRIIDIDCKALAELIFSLFMVKAPEFSGADVENDPALEEFTDRCTDYFYELLAVR